MEVLVDWSLTVGGKDPLMSTTGKIHLLESGTVGALYERPGGRRPPLQLAEQAQLRWTRAAEGMC